MEQMRGFAPSCGPRDPVILGPVLGAGCCHTQNIDGASEWELDTTHCGLVSESHQLVCDLWGGGRRPTVACGKERY